MQNAAYRHLSISLFASLALSACAANAHAQQVRYNSEHRDHERALPQTVSAPAATALKAKVRSGRTGVSLAVADFDADGTRDLITGYAVSNGGLLLLQRGSSLAMSPTPNEWPLLARGELVAPYRESAEAIDLPVRPDLLLTADVHGMGHPDLIAAAKGGSSVYVLYGRGDGTFSAPSELRLMGAVQSLTTWTDASGENLMVAGVCARANCGLQFLDREGKTRAFVAAPGAVTTLVNGSIDGGSRQDLVYIANERPMVLEGDTALSGAPVIEKLPMTHAAALAVGYFVADRRGYQQIAALDSNATLHVLTRVGLDSTLGTSAERLAARRGRTVQAVAARQVSTSRSALSGIGMSAVAPVKRTGMAWAEVETLSNIGPGGDSPILLSAKLTTGGNDDLAVLSGYQYTTVSHVVTKNGIQVTTTPVVSVDSSSAPVTAAVATRVSADARLGLVTANNGVRPLSVSVPTTYHTYTVTTTLDGNDDLTSAGRCTGTGTCTLRDAVNLANHDRSVTSPGTIPNTSIFESDRINIPPGTYTLSVYNATGYGSTTTQSRDKLGSVNYHLEVDSSVNFVGAGSASTIINGNNLDQVFSVDYGSYASSGPGDYEAPQVDVFFSGMTIENGKNPNSYSGSYPYSNPFGGNMYWEAEPSSNLVLNSVVLTGGTSAASGGTDIGGGGIAAGYDASNASNTAGPLDIENSTITGNNDSSGSGGGGIAIFFAVPLTLISDSITNNTALMGGGGGGVSVDEDGANFTATITNSTISSNITASPESYGGGLFVRGGLSMSGTTVSGNVGIDYGGGLYLNNGNGTSSYTGAITTSTFTGNSLTGTLSGPTYPQDGGGVCIFGASGSQSGSVVNVQYSRFHGNTVSSGTAATGLAVGCDSQVSGSNPIYANVTAADNWWGCNGAASGTGCDTAHAGNVTSATLTLSPYTTLTLNLSASSVALGGSITATGSLGQDSNTTVYSAANDAAYLATPISAFTLTKTSTVTYNPSATAFGTGVVSSSISNAAATATATTNSAGTGTATITVDGTSVTANYSVLAAPTISESFNASPVAPGTHSVVTFTLGNPAANTVSITGLGFTDTLPTNLLVYTTPGVSNTCGGTVTATAGSSSISLSGGSVASGATCTVSVSVYSNTLGSYTNTTGNVTSSNAGSGTTGSATLTVSNTRSVEVVSPTIHFSQPLNGGPNAYITAIFSFAGTQAPTGAVTFTVTNSSGSSVGALSGQTCVAKSLHTNCTVSFSASGVPVGNYTLTVNQASDSFYTAVSGTGFVTVVN